MAFIGNTNTTQAFTPAIDYFSGNASTTAFTLSKPVASVAQVQVVVNNVAQNPSSAYTVSGNTITFTSAPSSGTNNIYVYYTSPITQVIAPSQGTVGTTQLQNGLTVNFADGTAAAPSITNDGDTNTGIFFPAADTIAFTEGGVEAMRIDSSANVGIGTSSPGQKLEVNNGASDVTVLSKTTGASYASFRVTNSSRDYSMQIRTDVSNAWVLRDETAGSNRLVVDTSGNVLVGTTSTAPRDFSSGGGIALQPAAASEFASASSSVSFINYTGSSAGSGTFITFRQQGAARGSISTNGSVTAYNTSSDYRLKNTIAPMTGALAKVSQLKPVTYKWNANNSESEGFIAHELAEVVPQCVTGEKDEIDADGSPVYQGIDVSFLVATLTAAIQELKALTDTQASTITALTARITALENK